MKQLRTITRAHFRQVRMRRVISDAPAASNTCPRQKVKKLRLTYIVIEHGKMPSPVHYVKPGFFSPKQSMNAFSFGVSRDNMKKIHIQAIEKVAMEKLPAPNAYSMPSTFGKVGPHYSLRADTSRTESKENAQLICFIVTRFIQKKGLEPGPGEYKKIEVVGTLNPSKLTSIIQTPQANAFSKAKDRFSIPSNNR